MFEILLQINVIYSLAIEDGIDFVQRYCIFMLERNIDACTIAREM